MRALLLFSLLILLTIVLVNCSNDSLQNLPDSPPFPEIPSLPESPVVENKLGEKVKLWSTYYNVLTYKKESGVWVRDIKGKKLVEVSLDSYCQLAMEGTGYIDGKTYNYAGTTRSYYVSGCSYKPSGKAKFYVTNSPFGVGNKDNNLVPFRSIACDQRKFGFGQKFHIPEAVGTKLPNGVLHDGVFICSDTGGLIKGNHIDVFIGSETKNPFEFVKSSFDKTFTAYLVE